MLFWARLSVGKLVYMYKASTLL